MSTKPISASSGQFDLYPIEETDSTQTVEARHSYNMHPAAARGYASEDEAISTQPLPSDDDEIDATQPFDEETHQAKRARTGPKCADQDESPPVKPFVRTPSSIEARFLEYRIPERRQPSGQPL